jgi:hypothetical protein
MSNRSRLLEGSYEAEFLVLNSKSDLERQRYTINVLDIALESLYNNSIAIGMAVCAQCEGI